MFEEVFKLISLFERTRTDWKDVCREQIRETLGEAAVMLFEWVVI